MRILRTTYYWIVVGLLFAIYSVLLSIMILFFSAPVVDSWLKKRFHFLFRLLHCPVEVSGQEHIDPETTYLFMGNHLSLFDVPFLQAFIPVYARGVEARQHFKWPVYGWFIRRLGNIPIDRKNIHKSIQSIRKAEGRLKSGFSMIVLPEGHRTMDGKMRPFKKLPFFLAKQSGTPIMPFGMSGLYTLKNKNSIHITPTPLKIKFGPVIPAETVQKTPILELMDTTRKRINQLVEYP